MTDHMRHNPPSDAAFPEQLTRDPLWKLEAYRLAVEATRAGWPDATTLHRDRRTGAMASQLWRALGSIRADLAEGYSRSSGLDRARFYEYALGSAREAREWYHCGLYVLGERNTDSAMTRLSSIVRLVLTALPYERGRRIGRR